MNWFEEFHDRELIITGLDISTNCSEITNRILFNDCIVNNSSYKMSNLISCDSSFDISQHKIKSFRRSINQRLLHENINLSCSFPTYFATLHQFFW
jgi:hypothetical protein